MTMFNVHFLGETTNQAGIFGSVATNILLTCTLGIGKGPTMWKFTESLCRIFRRSFKRSERRAMPAILLSRRKRAQQTEQPSAEVVVDHLSRWVFNQLTALDSAWISILVDVECPSFVVWGSLSCVTSVPTAWISESPGCCCWDVLACMICKLLVVPVCASDTPWC